MRKIVIATVAAMVLVSGASAADEINIKNLSADNICANVNVDIVDAYGKTSVVKTPLLLALPRYIGNDEDAATAIAVITQREEAGRPEYKYNENDFYQVNVRAGLISGMLKQIGITGGLIPATFQIQNLQGAKGSTIQTASVDMNFLATKIGNFITEKRDLQLLLSYLYVTRDSFQGIPMIEQFVCLRGHSNNAAIGVYAALTLTDGKGNGTADFSLVNAFLKGNKSEQVRAMMNYARVKKVFDLVPVMEDKKTAQLENAQKAEKDLFSERTKDLDAKTCSIYAGNKNILDTQAFKIANLPVGPVVAFGHTEKGFFSDDFKVTAVAQISSCLSKSESRTLSQAHQQWETAEKLPIEMIQRFIDDNPDGNTDNNKSNGSVVGSVFNGITKGFNFVNDSVNNGADWVSDHTVGAIIPGAKSH